MSDSIAVCLQAIRYSRKKDCSVLKNRRWVADYEEGLQKVYYKENIIAKIYALADWFSPSDIEAPTLSGLIFRPQYICAN